MEAVYACFSIARTLSQVSQVNLELCVYLHLFECSENNENYLSLTKKCLDTLFINNYISG